MIRLGSLAGYVFSGPRVLGGWTPPARPGVYAILYKPEPETRREHYAVTYVGHADDLAAAGFPFKHRRSPCWIQRAGSKWNLHVAFLEVPGGTRAHREQIVQELGAVYHPHCNETRYDHTWRAEWIGAYSGAPNTAPLPPQPDT
ncbi:hypothetical protein [Pseudonocardia sp. GCM10023141]|uniref:hypothetical protein n=1 Tax=Pseudonocardia sp. GCM10023141 TaxID=3252653 RepID=UPI00360E2B6F